MHDNTLTQNNRDKFIYLAGRYGQIIKFYNVEEICADEIARIKKLFTNETKSSIFSIGKFFKLIIPLALPEDITKVIYLDADIIVNLDINELWKISLGDKSLAAVPDVTHYTDALKNVVLCQEGLVATDDYFNSGVMVINLKKIRHNEMENLWEGIKFRAENPKYVRFDQEILNYCFSKDLLKLDYKFNTFVKFYLEKGNSQPDQRIFHYLANVLNFDFSNKFNLLWFNYFEKTPFFDKEQLANLDRFYMNLLKNNVVRLKNFALQVTALMSGKSRAFFIPAPNIEMAKKIFLIRDDEEIIPLVNQESFQNLLTSMNNSHGKKVFLIFFEGYLQLRTDLMQAGFVEGRDFVNAAMFLPNINEVEIVTDDLIKAIM